MPSSLKCVQCQNAATKRCAKCHNANAESIYYCSKECQRDNWYAHKHFCGILLPRNIVPEGNRTARGILLPVDGTKPIFVDVPFERVDRSDDNVDRGSFLFTPGIDKPGSTPPVELRHVTHSKRNRRPFGHMLEFIFRDCYQFDGSKSNQCAHAITNGKLRQRFDGPILVLKFTDEFAHPDQATLIMDIEIKDATDIVDVFLLSNL
ncbi:MYND finger domain-containing protein [Ditylenchus destructor]|nr:MYND finger domain-containing protein [Ditylenchus destructor]